MIQSQLQDQRWALFGISRKFIVKIATKRRHGATGGRHRPARLDPAEPHCHRSTTGIARDTHVLRIDFTASQQVIESPDAVPGPPRPEELTHQELLIPPQQVLTHTNPDG